MSTPRQVVVTGGAAPFEQAITIGPHTLVADEPVDLGGGDAGPTPYDLLLAALGSCTSMTLTLYARKKGWPLERVSVALTHARIHAADCKDCEQKTGRIERVERVLTLEGPLSDEQRARLLEIADKCPVLKTMLSQLEVKSRLADQTAGA
jgi:putative redox protein